MVMSAGTASRAHLEEEHSGTVACLTLVHGHVCRYGITRAHLEEDSGKTVYGGADRMAGSEYSLVDFNRAGEAVHWQMRLIFVRAVDECMWC